MNFGGGTRVNDLTPAVSSDNYYLVKPAHHAVLQELHRSLCCQIQCHSARCHPLLLKALTDRPKW